MSDEERPDGVPDEALKWPLGERCVLWLWPNTKLRAYAVVQVDGEKVASPIVDIGQLGAAVESYMEKYVDG